MNGVRQLTSYQYIFKEILFHMVSFMFYLYFLFLDVNLHKYVVCPKKENSGFSFKDMVLFFKFPAQDSTD